MTKRPQLWFLVAIVILSIATVVGFTSIQRNFADHEHLDAHACALSQINRTIIGEEMAAIIIDPSISQETKKTLTLLHNEVNQLLKIKCGDLDS